MYPIRMGIENQWTATDTKVSFELFVFPPTGSFQWMDQHDTWHLKT